jgi:hypothetical protein
VLIGQLSTAAGVRAPLARIADQVFVDLARELESQGVGRRVAADMFGMALRSYQKKLRRLTASESAADRTLWSAALEHIRQHQPVRKSDLLRRFARDGEREVGSIINDLVGSGLIYQTGRGLAALYRVTSEPDLRKLAGSDDPEALAPVVWSAVFDRPGTSENELATQLGASSELVQRAVQSLIQEGRLRRDAPSADAPLHAEDLVVPVGATHGWEVAVHDHFRAVANAIASKLQQGTVQARGSDVVGGATLSFDVHAAHPYRAQVIGLLAETRARANALWNEVEAFNARNPLAEAERERLFFYFGQYLEAAPNGESEAELEDESEGVDDE